VIDTRDWRDTDTWEACRQTTRDRGLSAGLAVLLSSAGPDVLPFGPRGHALVTADVARSARWVRQLGGTTERDRGRETVVAEFDLDGDALIALRRNAFEVPGTADRPSRWTTGLAWLRLGLSERLLDQCLTYLHARTTAGRPLLDMQLVRGDLADGYVDLLEVDTLLTQGPGPHLGSDPLWRVHQRITRAGRALLRLLGASGFLADGPGRDAYLSELLANIYVPMPVSPDLASP
jgi:hypothetical protein